MKIATGEKKKNQGMWWELHEKFEADLIEDEEKEVASTEKPKTPKKKKKKSKKK